MTRKAGRNRDEMLEVCLEHIRALPFVRKAKIRGPGSSGEDGLLVIETPTGPEILPLEIKRSQLGREIAEFLVHRARERAGLMVFAPTVGRHVGSIFEQGHVNFMDMAGNCALDLKGRYISRIQGRPAPARKSVDRGLRAPAYRALFTLLVKPELVAATTRTIARQAEVSPQTASNLVNLLSDRGMILKTKRHAVWAPGGRKDALTLWLAGFPTALAPSLLVGRYRAREGGVGELEAWIESTLGDPGKWRYGGGAAAMRLTHYYRGERTLLYLADLDPAEATRRLRLVRDPNGPIALSRAPAKAAFESTDPRSVHPLLAYADLLVEGHERAHDAAAVLYDRFIIPMEGPP